MLIREGNEAWWPSHCTNIRSFIDSNRARNVIRCWLFHFHTDMIHVYWIYRLSRNTGKTDNWEKDQ